MKFLFKLLVLVVLAAALYVGSYFVVMEEGTALNPESFVPEYHSVSVFAEGVRVGGGVDFTMTRSHWTNPLYEPLDRVFR